MSEGNVYSEDEIGYYRLVESHTVCNCERMWCRGGDDCHHPYTFPVKKEYLEVQSENCSECHAIQSVKPHSLTVEDGHKHSLGETCYILKCINCGYTRYPYTPKIFEVPQRYVSTNHNPRPVQGALSSGSEKQLKWAYDIKQRFQALANRTSDTQLPDIRHAVFWIDNRDSSLEQLREAARKRGYSPTKKKEVSHDS